MASRKPNPSKSKKARVGKPVAGGRARAGSRAEPAPEPPSSSTSPRAAAGHDSREALIAAARSVFARQGYDGATVKDLADAARVNVSLVSYYFGGKEGLYRAAIESFGRDRVAAIERLLKPAADLSEFQLRLRLFAEEFIESHAQNPDVATILHRDFDGGHPIALSVFKDVFMLAYERLCSFVREGQEAGYLRRIEDHETATGLMFGGLMHMLRSDALVHAVRGRSIMTDLEFRQSVIDQFVHQAIHGLAVPADAASKNGGAR